MKKLTLVVVLIGITQFITAQIYIELSRDTTLTFEQIVNETENYFDTVGREKHSGYKQFKRWEYWTRRSLDSNGKIIPNYKARQEVSGFKSTQPTQRSMTGSWSEMGPISASNTSTWSSHLGRISSIGLDINDTDHMIVGSPTGGVWRTTDEGTSWTPIFDEETIINISSLAISHENDDHYYAGTSGLGVMRSVDAGVTWTPTAGIPNSESIVTIALDPVDANIVIAISVFGEIYRSSDAGDNWTTVLSTSHNMYDLEFKPNDSNSIYASGDGELYISNDNGITFTPLSGPWANDQALMMAVTEDDAEYLYVLQEDGGGFGALYLSTDGGTTFTTQSDNTTGDNNIMGYNLNNSGGQAPRDMDVVVSPTDKTEVHVAGIMTFKSTDSGQTWDQTTHWVISNPLPFIHADCDIMFYQNDKIYFGTDGGIFISSDQGGTFDDKTTGLGIRQFYRIGVSQTAIDRVSGGSQDNGTGTVDGGAWTDWVGADGMETFIDKSDEDIIYASIQFGSLYKTINGGNSLASITNTPGSGEWVTPLEEDPFVANTLYQGKAELYKSDNGGDSWSAISSFDPADPNDENLAEVSISPVDNSIIYAAFRHQVFLTTDGGVNWSDVSPTVSFSNVNYISTHPTDANKALIVLSGTSQKILETVDQGITWTDISSGLPSIGAECAVYEGGASDGIYVAMNPGIYYSSDVQTNWIEYNTALPNVRVAELEIKNNLIYAASYGRGLWKNNLFENLECNISAIIDAGATNCSNTTGTYDRLLDVIYLGPPPTGTLDVNGQSFIVTGSPQRVTLSGLPTDGAMTDAMATFSAEPGCTLTEVDLYVNPNTCPCLLNNANLLIETCEDQGTSDASDDTYTFSVNPTGENLGGSYSIMGDITHNNLSYGMPTLLDNGGVGFLINDGPLNINITDDDDSTCQISDIEIVPPNTCFENFACETAFEILSTGIHTAIGPNQGNGGSQPGRHANWFVYTPAVDGELSVNSCDMLVDTRLYIHDGSCTAYNQIASSDDNCALGNGSGNNYASEIAGLCVTGGVKYLIEWDDRWSQSGFDFELLFETDTFYVDNDLDGFGDINSPVYGCTQPAGAVLDSTDCDDTNASVYPGAIEVCDGLDNDCNNEIDEGLAVITYYLDNDGDGYGDNSNSLDTCQTVSGYVIDNTDCDDNDANIFPGATEICDGLDNDCNGMTDDGLVVTTYYLDNDGDSYGDNNISIDSCQAIAGYVTDNTDCDDNDANIFPGATEICDGLDNDCNGMTDDGLAVTTYYLDNDGDGYGDNNNSIDTCQAITGYVIDNTDCEDSDANISPGATEVCGDSIDNNCDGQIDEGCILPPCDSITIVVDTVAQNLYHAEINLSSGAVIDLSTPVAFKAGTEIDLTPDFEVLLGSEFEANIEPCTNSTPANTQPTAKLFLVSIIDENNKVIKSKSGTEELLDEFAKEVLENLDKKWTLKIDVFNP